MGEQIEKLAQFVARTGWDDMPEAVHRRAKLVLLDTIGVTLAGAARPEVMGLSARLLAGAGRGATVLAAGLPQADIRTAALLNGIAARSVELCEGANGLQPSPHILPGVLAIAEQRGLGGRAMLGAFVLGYEVAGRLNRAYTQRAFSHPNGQLSLLGAAAAGARLHGLDGLGVSLAMRVATSMLMTPSYNNTVAGGTTLNLPAGLAAMAATLAPEMALAGYAAQDDAIEEALGVMVGAGFAPEKLPDDMGRRWEILDNYFRFYACCNPIHAALDSLAETLAVLKPKPRGRRANRRADLRLRLGHAQSGPAQLLRVEIFAAPCGGGADRARRPGLCRDRRQRARGSRHRHAAAAGADRGGSGDDGTQHAFDQARPCHADAEGRAQCCGGAGGVRTGYGEAGLGAPRSHEVSRTGGGAPDASGDGRDRSGRGSLRRLADDGGADRAAAAARPIIDLRLNNPAVSPGLSPVAKNAVIPTEAERSSAKWRDLFCLPRQQEEVPRLRRPSGGFARDDETNSHRR